MQTESVREPHLSDIQRLVSLRHCAETSDLMQVLADLAKDTSLNVPRGSRVVIKPNLNDLVGPNSGLTTDVQVVRALVQYLTENWTLNEVLIVESDSWNRLADEAFAHLGYREIEKTYHNTKLVNLTKAPCVTVELPVCSYYRLMRIPRLFMETNFFISVAKLRTHITGISGILKNQFGCVPRRFKGKYHPYLSNIITNMNLLLRPNWCLMDGIVGYDVKPRKVGIVLASNDPVALDSTVARIMGFDPHKLAHIDDSCRNGVGNIDGLRVLLDGEDLSDVNSIISPRFIVPSQFAITISEFGRRFTRAIDRLRAFSSTLERIATFSAGAAAYPKLELMKMLLERRRLNAAYRRLGEMQSRLDSLG
jgi:uncharacterized protein (DUF362 family)